MQGKKLCQGSPRFICFQPTIYGILCNKVLENSTLMYVRLVLKSNLESTAGYDGLAIHGVRRKHCQGIVRQGLSKCLQ